MSESPLSTFTESPSSTFTTPARSNNELPFPVVSVLESNGEIQELRAKVLVLSSQVKNLNSAVKAIFDALIATHYGTKTGVETAMKVIGVQEALFSSE